MKLLIARSRDGESGAVLSDDEQYRYRLWRAWSDGPRLGFIMLNPSISDHLTNGVTLRRCIARAKTLHYSGIEVVNLYALRSSDPRALLVHEQPRGDEEFANLMMLSALRDCERIVCAWGAHAMANARAQAVLRLLSRARLTSRLCCLGLTASGAPRHPLYAGSSEVLRKYNTL